MLGYVDSVATVLNKGAQQRNFQRWQVLGKYVWPNPPDYAVLTSYEAEVNWLKQWLVARLNHLDDRLQFVISGVEDSDPASINVTAYPNPFQSDVSFEYAISEPGNVSILIYDALGREAARVEENRTHAGTFTVSTSLGSQASGLFFYQMYFNGKSSARGHLSKR